MNKRAEFVDKLKHKLDDWNQDLDELEAKADNVKADLQEKYKEELASVREQQETVKQKANELIGASEDAWEELKTGVEEAWHKLSEAIERAHSKF